MPLTANFTINDVTFEVMNVQSAVEYAADQENSRVVVTYRVYWDLRHAARMALLGNTVFTTDPAFTDRAYLARTLPHKWIEEELNTLYCAAVTKIVGLQTLDAPSVYQYAMITAMYQDFPYDFATDDEMFGSAITVPDESELRRWVEYGDREAHSKITNTNGIGFVYAHTANPLANDSRTGMPPQADDDPVLFTTPVVIGNPLYTVVEHIELIWHQVPMAHSPDDIIATMMNKINNAPFYNRTARTLMLVRAKPVRCRLPDRTRAYNWHFTFAYNRFGWDKMPDPTKGLQYFQVVSRDDHTRLMYEQGDFRTLFRPV